MKTTWHFLVAPRNRDLTGSDVVAKLRPNAKLKLLKYISNEYYPTSTRARGTIRIRQDSVPSVTHEFLVSRLSQLMHSDWKLDE